MRHGPALKRVLNAKTVTPIAQKKTVIWLKGVPLGISTDEVRDTLLRHLLPSGPVTKQTVATNTTTSSSADMSSSAHTARPPDVSRFLLHHTPESGLARLEFDSVSEAKDLRRRIETGHFRVRNISVRTGIRSLKTAFETYPKTKATKTAASNSESDIGPPPVSSATLSADTTSETVINPTQKQSLKLTKSQFYTIYPIPLSLPHPPIPLIQALKRAGWDVRQVFVPYDADGCVEGVAIVELAPGCRGTDEKADEEERKTVLDGQLLTMSPSSITAKELRGLIRAWRRFYSLPPPPPVVSPALPKEEDPEPSYTLPPPLSIRDLLFKFPHPRPSAKHTRAQFFPVQREIETGHWPKSWKNRALNSYAEVVRRGVREQYVHGGEEGVRWRMRGRRKKEGEEDFSPAAVWKRKEAQRLERLANWVANRETRSIGRDKGQDKGQNEEGEDEDGNREQNVYEDEDEDKESEEREERKRNGRRKSWGLIT